MESEKIKINWLQVKVWTFLLSAFAVIMYLAMRSNESREMSINTASTVDSIQQVIDYRYTSYDELFNSTNAIVINGEFYVYTNMGELDHFYEQKDRRKTQNYYNIKNKLIKVIDKNIDTIKLNIKHNDKD